MTITKEQINVVTSVERRLRWSVKEKQSIMHEPYIPGMSELPEINGMGEAFVNTVKRDYVWFGDLGDAKSVMSQLPK
jgi:hypothetical protein